MFVFKKVHPGQYDINLTFMPSKLSCFAYFISLFRAFMVRINLECIQKQPEIRMRRGSLRKINVNLFFFRSGKAPTIIFWSIFYEL